MFGLSLTPGTVFISVWNCRVAVNRYLAVPGGISYEPATNWEALEEAANAAVEAQGGAFNLSGHYVCPQELAERATWAEVEKDERPDSDSERSP